MHRLAILSTHPIQYNAPLFRMLHEDDGINLQVFFSKTWEQVKFDPDFQREVVWDIPISKGYPHATHDASSKAGKAALAAAIRDFGPAALLVYGWNFPGHLAMMRAFHGSIPIWFRGDSHLLDPLPLWKKALRRLWLTWVYRHIDFAFTVGSANEAYFQWCGLKPVQMTRAPHAVDNAFFETNHEARLENAMRQRAQLGISATDHVVLFAGKLASKKQPEFLLEAWRHLDDSNCHVVIAGAGPQEAEIQERWSPHPRVHFIGFQNQTSMPITYRMADVFCLPSAGPGETWGLAINEALACRIPCLVSDRAGCGQDLIADSSNGRLLPPNDLNAWTTSIREVLQSGRTAKLPAEFNHQVLVDHISKKLNAE